MPASRGRRLREQLVQALLRRLLPKPRSPRGLDSRLGHYLLLLASVTGVLSGALVLIWVQESGEIAADADGLLADALGAGFMKLYAALIVIAAVRLLVAGAGLAKAGASRRRNRIARRHC